MLHVYAVVESIMLCTYTAAGARLTGMKLQQSPHGATATVEQETRHAWRAHVVLLHAIMCASACMAKQSTVKWTCSSSGDVHQQEGPPAHHSMHCCHCIGYRICVGCWVGCGVTANGTVGMLAHRQRTVQYMSACKRGRQAC
jgi:hypothetical protein